LGEGELVRYGDSILANGHQDLVAVLHQIAILLEYPPKIIFQTSDKTL
jgi:hypothetical protein